MDRLEPAVPDLERFAEAERVDLVVERDPPRVDEDDALRPLAAPRRAVDLPPDLRGDFPADFRADFAGDLLRAFEPPERRLPPDAPLDFAFAIEPPSCVFATCWLLFLSQGGAKWE